MLRLVFLPLILAFPLTAAQVQVTLNDGQVVEGEILKEDAASVSLQQSIIGRKGTMKATMVYDRARISKIEPLADPATRYAAAAAKTEDTAPAQLGLAEWCRAHDLPAQAAERAQHVLTLDKENKKARELLNALGFFEFEEQWLTEADYCAKTGKVRYRGEFLTPEEVEAVKNGQPASSTGPNGDAAGDPLNRAVADLDRQIKVLEDRRAQSTKNLTAANDSEKNLVVLENDLQSAQDTIDIEKKNFKGVVSERAQDAYNLAKTRLDAERAVSSTSAATKIEEPDRIAGLDKLIAELKEKRKVQAEWARAAKEKADKEKAEKEAKLAADRAKAAAPKPPPAKKVAPKNLHGKQKGGGDGLANAGAMDRTF